MLSGADPERNITKMALNGFKIFDSNTNVGPCMDVLSHDLSDAENAPLARWDECRSVRAPHDPGPGLALMATVLSAGALLLGSMASGLGGC